MKNKKGFTLIELLAVIVILGVIVLIAIPSLSGFIKRSKMDSLKASADGIARAAGLYRSDSQNSDDVITFSILNGKEIGVNKLNYKGKVDTGTIMIYGEDEVSFCVTSDRYVALKNINDTKISVVEGSCVFDEDTQTFEAKEYCGDYKDEMDALTVSQQEELNSLEEAYKLQIKTLEESYASQVSTLNQTITNINNNNASTKKVVLLGSGAATYDVTTYPGYQSFTADNFIVEGHYTSSSSADHNRGVSATAYIGKTYNATTGKLTVTNGSASGDVSNSTMNYIRAYSYVNKVYLVY